MENKFPKEVAEIFEKFQKAGFQLYLVGGAVRDLLMGKSTKDWDFTTDAKPEEILKLFPEGFYNNKFGTVGINSQNLGVLEVTTMRKEGNYKDHRHPVEVSWTDKLNEDLARRDFTVNTMALDKNQKVFDPFDGQKDLRNGTLRAVGDPDKRFKEDALRLMRAIRISSEIDFEIDSKTLEAIHKNKDLIKDVANERVREELFKIFTSPDPYIGLKALRETGLLQIILPEVDDCFGIVQEGPKHDRIYDIGEHSFLTLKFTPSKNPTVLFAALLHDIGKVKTYKKDENGNVTFYNHDAVGATLALEIAKRFNLSKAQTDKLVKLVRWHMFTINEDQTDSAVRRFIKNAGIENIEDIFALRIGDRLGGGTKTAVSWRMEKYKERIDQVMHKPFSVTDLKVNGEDVMKALGIKPGRKVGEVLQKLFKEVQEDQTKNNKEFLLKRIKQL